MPPLEKVLVNLVTGFDKAGKTEFLRRLLLSAPAAERLAVLTTADQSILDEAVKARSAAIPAGSDDQGAPLSNVLVRRIDGPCPCCEGVAAFQWALREVVDGFHPDRIVVEAPSSAEPSRLQAAFFQNAAASRRMRLEPSLCVVDASLFHSLLREHSHRYVRPIRGANVVLLNQVDHCPPSQLADVRSSVEDLNPRAWIQELTTDDLGLPLLYMGRWTEGDCSAEGLSATEAAYHCFSHVIEGPPLDRARLERLLMRLPRELFRLSGTVRVSEGTFRLEYVTGQYEFEPAPDSEASSFTFVGRKLNRERFRTLLERCRP